MHQFLSAIQNGIAMWLMIWDPLEASDFDHMNFDFEPTDVLHSSYSNESLKDDIAPISIDKFSMENPSEVCLPSANLVGQLEQSACSVTI